MFFLYSVKVTSSRLSPLVAHLRISRLFMKGNFDAYVLWPWAKKVENWIIDWSNAHDFMVRSCKFYHSRIEVLKNCSVFCVSVSLLRGNLRRLRRNLNHIIKTLFIFSPKMKRLINPSDKKLSDGVDFRTVTHSARGKVVGCNLV